MQAMIINHILESYWLNEIKGRLSIGDLFM